VLDQEVVQIRLHLPPDGQFSRPESSLVRALYDCSDVVIGDTGMLCGCVARKKLIW
jgi:hypothetical protein